MWCRSRGLLGLLLLSLAFAGLAWTGDLRVHTYAYLAFYGVAALGYLLTLSGRATLSLPLVLVVGLLARALLLPGEPTLSDDYHRYLWDGLVQQEGINPYLYAPADAALDHVPYPERVLINHPDTRTIYPPMSEILFLGLTVTGLGSLVGLKLALGGLDLGTALLIYLLVDRRRRVTALAAYLLHPLVIQETWGSAHIDAAHVLLLVAGVALILRRRDMAAGLALGAGAAFKLVPLLVVLPALLGSRVRPGRFLVGLGAAFLLPYTPYVLGGSFLGSLTSTGAKPEFNSSIFYLLDLTLPYAAARYLCIALYLAGTVGLALALRGRTRTPELFAWTLTWATLLLPVVHPWYWLGPLALGAVADVRLPALLGLAAPASYATYASLPFAQRSWARVVSYVPLLGARRDLKALAKEWPSTKLNPPA